MEMIRNLKNRAEKMRFELQALYYAYQSPEVGFWPKILIALAIIYALSPVDLIPDFIPILGYLDDLMIVPGLIGWSIKLIPPTVMERCREQAREEPVSFKKSWKAGALFIFVWAVLVFLLGWAIYQRIYLR